MLMMMIIVIMVMMSTLDSNGDDGVCDDKDKDTHTKGTKKKIHTGESFPMSWIMTR